MGDVADVDEVAHLAAVLEHPRRAAGLEPEVTGEFRLGDVRHVFASAERARDVLGFTAAVAFEEGVTEFATAPLR